MSNGQEAIAFQKTTDILLQAGAALSGSQKSVVTKENITQVGDNWKNYFELKEPENLTTEEQKKFEKFKENLGNLLEAYVNLEGVAEHLNKRLKSSGGGQEIAKISINPQRKNGLIEHTEGRYTVWSNLADNEESEKNEICLDYEEFNKEDCLNNDQVKVIIEAVLGAVGMEKVHYEIDGDHSEIFSRNKQDDNISKEKKPGKKLSAVDNYGKVTTITTDAYYDDKAAGIFSKLKQNIKLCPSDPITVPPINTPADSTSVGNKAGQNR